MHRNESMDICRVLSTLSSLHMKKAPVFVNSIAFLSHFKAVNSKSLLHEGFLNQKLNRNILQIEFFVK